MMFVLVKQLTSVKWLFDYSRHDAYNNARHKIRFSFIVQLTYVMSSSEWYGHVPYECHFL